MDAAEDEEKKEVVRRINVGGTQYIADACKACGCKLLYLSTDYVFNGQGQLVQLGFDVAVFTPAAYQRRSLRRP